MGVDFDLCFQYVATYFLKGFTFDPATFVRLHQVTSTGLSLLDRDAAFNLPGKLNKNPTQAVIVNMDDYTGNNIE